MNLPEFFQNLCESRHPLERGLRLEEFLRNGGGHDLTATVSTILAKWQAVPFSEETGRTPLERQTVARVLPSVFSRLDQVLVRTVHGSAERSAAIAKALQELPTETERGVLLGLLLARRSGPLAECLYVTSGSTRQPAEAFEAPDLRKLMLK